MESFDTPRLRLRLLQPVDEALYCALYTDPGVMEHVGSPLSADAARRGFSDARRRNAAADGTQRRWAVLDRGSGEALGLLALLRDPLDPDDAELGVMLLPAAHGRGFAREISGAVVAHAFGPGGWGLRRLWARHAPGHAAAAGVLQASGFQPAAPRDGQVIVARSRGDRP